MTIQEAYKSLSLARGAAQDRVEQQYKELKSEFEQKQSNSKSSKLTDIYKSRLLEIEDAYEVLNHYLKTETNSKDYPDESNSMTVVTVTEELKDSNDGIKINISRQLKDHRVLPPRKTQKSKIWLLYSVIFIIIIAVLFSVFKEDPFEAKEGERRTLTAIEYNNLESFTSENGLYTIDIPKGLFKLIKENEYYSDKLNSRIILHFSETSQIDDPKAIWNKKDLIQKMKKNIAVTYNVAKKDWVIVSGTNKNGEIVYKKGIYFKPEDNHMGENGRNTQPYCFTGILEITYSTEQKEDFDKLIPILIKSFKCDFLSQSSYF